MAMKENLTKVMEMLKISCDKVAENMPMVKSELSKSFFQLKNQVSGLCKKCCEAKTLKESGTSENTRPESEPAQNSDNTKGPSAKSS